MNENLKVLELERRIKRLEKNESQPKFTYYFSSKTSGEKRKEHIFNFRLNCLCNCYLKFHTLVKSSGNNVIAYYKINGLKAKRTEFFGGTFNFDGIYPVEQGETTITVVLKDINPFSVDNVFFETFGNIDYIKDDCILTCINEENQSDILFCSDGDLFVKKYTNNYFYDVISKNFVKGGAFGKCNDGYMLFLITEKGRLYCEKYDVDFNFTNSKLIGENANSVCCLNGEKITMFSVVGNSIEKYTVDANLNFTKEKTNLKGKKVISNPMVKDCIIVVDFDGNGKLVRL